MNGETKTGVTTFFLNPQVDCGDIIDQVEVEIGPKESTGELYDHLMIPALMANSEMGKLCI